MDKYEDLVLQSTAKALDSRADLCLIELLRKLLRNEFSFSFKSNVNEVVCILNYTQNGELQCTIGSGKNMYLAVTGAIKEAGIEI